MKKNDNAMDIAKMGFCWNCGDLEDGSVIFCMKIWKCKNCATENFHGVDLCFNCGSKKT